MPLEENDADDSRSGHGARRSPRTTPGAFAYVRARRAGAGAGTHRVPRRRARPTSRARWKRTRNCRSRSRGHDYAPGDEIEMQIQAPYTGAGLITIERDRVYAWHWFRTTTTSSLQKITLPAGIEGNAYVSVAFVRDTGVGGDLHKPAVLRRAAVLDQSGCPQECHHPEDACAGEARREAASRVFARNARRASWCSRSTKASCRWRATARPIRWRISSRSARWMWRRSQILDLILPEFRGGGLDAAPGGDQEGALGRHLNPFRRKGEKPVAWWSGILDADSTPRDAGVHACRITSTARCASWPSPWRTTRSA